MTDNKDSRDKTHEPFEFELDENLLSQFPPIPALQASWVPVYLEPMPGSGERLTVAVAAFTGGDALVLPGLPEAAARAMYGRHADSILGLVSLVCDSLRAHLETAGTPEGWQSPIGKGAHLGCLQSGYADTLAELAEDGLKLVSSLAWFAPEPESQGHGGPTP